MTVAILAALLIVSLCLLFISIRINLLKSNNLMRELDSLYDRIGRLETIYQKYQDYQDDRR